MEGEDNSKMKKLLYSGQMKALDAYTIEQIGIPSPVLMERAALEVVLRIKARGCCGRILVLCGTGNNGGDGIAVARILFQQGFDSAYYVAGNEAHYTDQTRLQISIADALGVPRIYDPEPERPSVLVDALFGVGLSRPVTGEYARLIDWMNRMDAWKIAVDIPSGVDADTGQILGTAFRADETVTFAFGKPGLYLDPGRALAGKVSVAEIGVTWQEKAFTTVHCSGSRRLLEKADLQPLLYREPAGHKGTFGKVLAVAGSAGMCGAAYLCGAAALRTGCGMVRIQTPQENRIPLQTLLPEAMIACSDREADWQAYLDWADVLIIGPGLGTDENALRRFSWFLHGAWEQKKPVVLDADGLNLLSAFPENYKGWLDEGVILTPHIGEMSRLTGKNPADLTADRIRAAHETAQKYGAACIMKDAASVTASPTGEVYINTTGNNGMGTAGSGDVLAGVLGGLLALNCRREISKPDDPAIIADGGPYYASGRRDAPRGLSTPGVFIAAAGVYLHGMAGDLAAMEEGPHAMTAGSIVNHIGRAISESLK